MICKLFHPSAKQTCYQSVYYTIFTTHKYGSVYFLRLFLLSNLLMFINNSSVTITYSLLSTYKLLKERSNAGYLFFFLQCRYLHIPLKSPNQRNISFLSNYTNHNDVQKYISKFPSKLRKRNHDEQSNMFKYYNVGKIFARHFNVF